MKFLLSTIRAQDAAEKLSVTPAKAGAQQETLIRAIRVFWTPACAGVTGWFSTKH
jgi:hypothetical protein